jgi:hypothetical protein
MTLPGPLLLVLQVVRHVGILRPLLPAWQAESERGRVVVGGEGDS